MGLVLPREFIELEQRLHDPSFRRSRHVAELLADSFVEFGSSGRVYNRRQIIDELATEEPFSINADTFEATQVCPGIVRVTYRTLGEGRVVLRESVWFHDGTAWKMVFHRGMRTA